MKIEEKRWITSQDLFSAIDELLAENKQAVFTVTGNSMWPLISHGRDQVIVEKVNTVKKGDIVLFQTPVGNYLLHRITQIQGTCFESCGDGNCFKDGWFELDCIHAKVVSVIRKGKKINCESFFWKTAFSCWRLLYPVRKECIYVLKWSRGRKK